MAVTVSASFGLRDAAELPDFINFVQAAGAADCILLLEAPRTEATTRMDSADVSHLQALGRSARSHKSRPKHIAASCVVWDSFE